MKVIHQLGLIAIAAILALTACKKNGNADAKISGSLYMQTNSIKNEIIHYIRMEDGSLVEKQRIVTGGAGSGTYKPITGQESAPNAFEGVKSVILSADHKWLFTTNGGNNSVSSFKVADDGMLTLLDVTANRPACEWQKRYSKKPCLCREHKDLVCMSFLWTRSYSPILGNRWKADAEGRCLYRKHWRKG